MCDVCEFSNGAPVKERTVDIDSMSSRGLSIKS